MKRCGNMTRTSPLGCTRCCKPQVARVKRICKPPTQRESVHRTTGQQDTHMHMHSTAQATRRCQWDTHTHTHTHTSTYRCTRDGVACAARATLEPHARTHARTHAAATRTPYTAVPLERHWPVMINCTDTAGVGNMGVGTLEWHVQRTNTCGRLSSSQVQACDRPCQA